MEPLEVPSPRNQRLGLFGGTFNPIHWGHLRVASEARARLSLDPLLLIPAREPPHKRGAIDLATSDHRLAMVRLAAKEVVPEFTCSDIEMRREGPSYTIDTIQECLQHFGPSAQIFLLIGADSLPELVSWHRVEEIPALAQIIVLSRPGFALRVPDELKRVIGDHASLRIERDVLEVEPQLISATEIRARCRRGEDLSRYVPPSVDRYIRDHALYRSPAQSTS